MGNGFHKPESAAPHTAADWPNDTAADGSRPAHAGPRVLPVPPVVRGRHPVVGAAGPAPQPPSTATVRAASYLRTTASDPITAVEKAIVKSVHDAVAEYASRCGYSIVAYHHDTATDANLADRTAFRRMLDDLRDGLVTHVLVASRASLSERPEVRLAIAKLIADSGGEIVYCDRG